jgi:hypothetical protein
MIVLSFSKGFKYTAQVLIGPFAPADTCHLSGCKINPNNKRIPARLKALPENIGKIQGSHAQNFQILLL